MRERGGETGAMATVSRCIAASLPGVGHGGEEGPTLGGRAYSDGGQLDSEAVRAYVLMTRQDRSDLRGFCMCLMLLRLAAVEKKIVGKCQLLIGKLDNVVLVVALRRRGACEDKRSRGRVTRVPDEQRIYTVCALVYEECWCMYKSVYAGYM